MFRTVAVGFLSLAVAALGSAIASAPAAQDGDASKRTVTPEQYERWKTELSNWGRWGKDDEIGTMNLVTPAKRRAAADLVKEGVSVSLAHDPDTVKAVDNPEPYEHQMRGIALDRWGVSYHGVAHTHLDALAHVNENGVFYNGYKPDPAEVKQANRHFKNSIHNLKNGVFTRGVLIDLPRLKGVPYLAERYADSCRGSGGVGETGRRQGRIGRCAVHSHGCVDPPQGDRSVRARPERKGRRPSPVSHPVAEGARYRDHRK